ncbi:zinc finger protein 14-like [Wyeomyia smithii]|uniref:zinc finger protein 14-like n=1 Tax=Wyeomyia smithii TaxID=174621 RepID=UPI0024681DE4|nr:zinc finger protein 14-like [Wyeomyia smithii]
MTSELLKTLIECDLKVCRFCLQSSEKELFNIYSKIKHKRKRNFGIDTAIFKLLNLLDISVSQTDAYPKLICRECKELLSSIQRFRETVQKSAQVLAQARLLQGFPDEKFVEGSEYKCNETEMVEIEADVFYCNSDKASSAAPEEVVVIKEEQTNPDVEFVEPEYTDTEWVVYDEELDNTHEQEAGEPYEEEQPQENDDLQEEHITAEEDGSVEMSSETQSKQKKSVTKRLCTVCGIASTAMIVHMRTHTKIKPFKCEICSKCFYTNNKLRSHIKSAHTNEREYHCQICEKSFVLRKTLKAHMMSHESEKSHVCSYCPKSFLFRWARAKHERTHTGEKPFKCTLDGCGKTFASSSNLRQHQKTGAHQAQDGTREECKKCGKQFISKFALRAHHKNHE